MTARTFEGRVAFITGGSRGVGKCVALALAREGCHVVIAAKTEHPDSRIPGTIHDTAREIEALGRQALPLRLDVRDDGAVAKAVAETIATFGRIDFLVNNAGAMHWRSLEDSPMRKFDLVMGVNARGAYACTLAALPHMRRQGYGHILMMSPPVDVRGAAGKIAYATSKFGMTLIAHGLAEELAGENVAANALWPATMIESAATVNWGLGGPAMWRRPDILADAALRIFAKEPRTFSGHALIDEDFLRAEGETDFAKYRCDPSSEPPRIPFDFKATAGKP